MQPAEVISVSVRPHGAANATDWRTTVDGHPDFIATYNSVGGEPDKQWITIDTNPASPHYNRVYAMWVVFHGPFTPTPFVSYADARADGTHTAWSAPIHCRRRRTPRRARRICCRTSTAAASCTRRSRTRTRHTSPSRRRSPSTAPPTVVRRGRS